MKVVILYHPKSEHEGKVLDFVSEYKRLKNKEIETVSLETPEGAEKARVYDITIYPAILALKEDGQLINMWQGDNFPLLDQLDYYNQR
jgi:hypothetical protein